MEYVTNLYRRLEKELSDIMQNANGSLDLAAQSCHAVEAVMHELKKYITGYSFESREEEISFFKVDKPRFYCKLIYYIRLFDMESKIPASSGKARKEYFSKKLDAIESFFEDNLSFYQYWRSGATHLDEQYFTRDHFDLLLGLDTAYFDGDPVFTTSHDGKVAMILANELLADYINRVLEHGEPDKQQAHLSQHLSLGWGETKVAMIELLYALQSMGVFYNKKNNLKADVKQVADFFQALFNTDLGNYYRTFQEIRIRKKGRTSFIDKLRETLIQRMNESDENF